MSFRCHLVIALVVLISLPLAAQTQRNAPAQPTRNVGTNSGGTPTADEAAAKAAATGAGANSPNTGHPIKYPPGNQALSTRYAGQVPPQQPQSNRGAWGLLGLVGLLGLIGRRRMQVVVRGEPDTDLAA